MITIIQNYTYDDIKTSMRYLLDKASYSDEVRQLAIEIVDYKPEPISAIYDWVKENVRYTPDPVRNGQIELFTSPIRMIKDYREGRPMAEDCDGISLLTASLLRSLGYQSNIVLLDTRGQGFDHAVTQVILNGNTIMLDASTNKYPLGWEEHYYQKVVI